jgi:ArsR family transcriptional regulator, arsenate/arsenite/antimonite-responsive transcriptional repressor
LEFRTVVPRELGVVTENDRPVVAGVVQEQRVGRIVALGQALSDPIRVRMLGMMAEAAASGRGCCDLPDLGVPAEEGEVGICVCEFEDRFGMGQSKVSYHMRKLREAGLVREERRGRWSFYSLDGETARELLGSLSEHLGARAGAASGV